MKSPFKLPKADSYEFFYKYYKVKKAVFCFSLLVLLLDPFFDSLDLFSPLSALHFYFNAQPCFLPVS